jgi:hypothetical protein
LRRAFLLPARSRARADEIKLVVMPAHSASEDARERAYGAGIHVLFCNTIKDVDGRDKPGHDAK